MHSSDGGEEPLYCILDPQDMHAGYKVVRVGYDPVRGLHAYLFTNASSRTVQAAPKEPCTPRVERISCAMVESCASVEHGSSSADPHVEASTHDERCNIPQTAPGVLVE